MAYKIIWHKEAQKEYLNNLEYWIKHNQSLEYANKIVQEVDRIENLLKEMPCLGKSGRHKYFNKEVRVVLILHKFSLFYAVEDNHIIVIDFISNSILKNEGGLYNRYTDDE